MRTAHENVRTEIRRTDASVAATGGNGTQMRSRELTFDWIAPATLSLLLLLATWYQGAFALRHWAPVALLALVILAAAAASGALWVPERAARIALAGLWAFAVWSLLSAVWADSPGRAIEGGGRTVL